MILKKPTFEQMWDTRNSLIKNSVLNDPESGPLSRLRHGLLKRLPSRVVGLFPVAGSCLTSTNEVCSSGVLVMRSGGESTNRRGTTLVYDSIPENSIGIHLNSVDRTVSFYRVTDSSPLGLSGAIDDSEAAVAFREMTLASIELCR